MNWEEILNDPALQNLPFKIETNRFGQILMSPASNKHGMIQSDVGFEIRHRLNRGVIINKCSIDTSDGVKVADVAWASEEFLAEYGDQTPYPKAPEICVEVTPPPNSGAIEQKTELYLAKGALEVWIVNQDRQASFYSHSGEIKQSKIVPNFRI